MKIAIRLLAAALLLFGAVVVLGLYVGAGGLHDFDRFISHPLNLQRSASSDWLIALMQGISWIGGGVQRYFIVALLALALWRWWGWGAGLAMGLAALSSSMVSNLLKDSFGRLRPDLVPQLDPIQSFAYPSGHATNAAVVYMLFIMLVPQARHPGWQALAALMIVAAGVSRIMLGVHWPSDVLGGWMLGAAFALGTGAIIAWREHLRQTAFPSLLNPAEDGA